MIFLLLVLVRVDEDSPGKETDREREKIHCEKTIFTHRRADVQLAAWHGSRIKYF